MAGEVLLVIDDEPQIRRVVRHALEKDVGKLVEAATGRAGIDAAAAERPALVVLDIGLPDISGAEVCREIRTWSSAPIVVLTARHSDREKVELFDLGADDYVTKPFSTSEFQARIRAHLRRARLTPLSAADAPIVIGELTIDLAKPGVTRSGERVHLTKTEFQLLKVMLKHAGRTLTHRQLFTAVWGDSYSDAQQNLRVHVRSLRRKLEADPMRPTLIVTEPGVGYRIET
jgi:two-component system KDP operon response regulator KdpE